MKNLFNQICCTSFFVLTGLSSLVSAQIPEELYFDNFTVEDGLPGNEIRDITQDSLGFIWIATEGGITRYDGYEFEIFRNIPGDQTSISDDDVGQILTDKYGYIWVNTFVGIEKYDPLTNTFIRHFNNPDSPFYIKPGSISSFTSSSTSGDLWIGLVEDGLIRHDVVTGESIRYRSVISDSDTVSISFIGDIAEDQNGDIWIMAGSAGLLKFDQETDSLNKYNFEEEKHREIIETPQQKRLFVDNDNVLWLDATPVFDNKYQDLEPGDQTHLLTLDINSGSKQVLTYHPNEQPLKGPLISPVEFNDMIWHAQNYINAGDLGLHAYSKTDHTYKLFQHKAGDSNSLTEDFTTAVYLDSYGSLWVGTEIGLSKTDVRRKKFEAFSVNSENVKSRENNFGALLETDSNVFWIQKGSITDAIEWDRNKGTWKDLELPLDEENQSEITTAISSGVSIEDDLWFYSNDEDQFKSFSLNTGEIYEYSNPDTSMDFDGSLLDTFDEKTIWATGSQGLLEFNIQSATYEVHELVSPFIKNDTIPVMDISMASDSTIWCLTIDVPLDSARQTFGVLIHNFDPNTNTYTPLEINKNYLDALNHGFAIDIMTDSKGDFWISKSNGLVHYDLSEKHFTWYNQKDGLADLFVESTVEDNSGNIWIATTYGISRFDPKNKIFRNFDRSDGLRPIVIQSLYKRDNGELIFTGAGGLNIVDPKAIEDYGNPPPVVIKGVNSNGKRVVTEVPINEIDRLAIPWTRSGFEIEYTAINFRSADKTTYSYQMEGLSDEYIDAGTRRYAQFTNLQPGDYSFRVRATNAEGLSSQDDTVLAISILPPWWRSWWAYSLYGLIFAAGVFAVDRVQRRRVLYKEKERAREKELKQARKIEEAYHELEKSHKNLKAAQDQLVQQEKLASLGQLTAGIAHEIKNPLNFVNNFSELSVELIEEAREEIKVINSKFKIQNLELSDLLDDIETNLKTIHKHGSRADSIVKSMLEHSRGGDGNLEPTNLNGLVKEFVNLSFHGMRAGKYPINVDMEIDLDESIGEVPLIAEDFSRVIINLCNNAFDAMREKVIQNSESKIQNYSPKLTVRTYKKDQAKFVEIVDNGSGISDEIKDKILQPFFTTKKGTEGTGLGLSITNDIIKAHGGFLEVSTEQNKGTCLTIKLSKGG